MKSATCLHRATCDLKDCRGEHATCYDPDMAIDDVAHYNLRLKQERDDYRAALDSIWPYLEEDIDGPFKDPNWIEPSYASAIHEVKDVLEKWGK